MKSYINRFISFCVTVLLSGLLSFSAFSANTVIVSCDEVPAGESSLLVPVRVSSDTKVMGFKMSLSFSNEQVKVKNISRGSVTTKGSFVDNLGLNEGELDIVWHNTSEVDANGTLFVLTLDTTGVTKDTEITVEFSQPDTFNEAYEDVVFDCSNIIIKPEAIPTESQATTEAPLTTRAESTTTQEGEAGSSTSATTTVNTEYDDSQVADSVNNALENSGNDSIYDIDENEQEDFLNSVNTNMNTMLDTDEVYYNSYDEIVEDYENHYSDSFVNDVTLSVEPEALNNILNETLTEFGADTIDEVEDKKKFADSIESKLREQNPDIEKISDYVSDDIVINAIESLYNTNAQEIAESNKKSNNTPSDNSIVIIIVILVAVVAVIVVVVIIKKKNQ